jgi:cyanophycinase-like exopeptidase
MKRGDNGHVKVGIAKLTVIIQLHFSSRNRCPNLATNAVLVSRSFKGLVIGQATCGA